VDWSWLVFCAVPKLIDFADFSLYYECLRFISLNLSCIAAPDPEHSVFQRKERFCNLTTTCVEG